jgi:hypothetical protein
VRLIPRRPRDRSDAAIDNFERTDPTVPIEHTVGALVELVK